MNKPEDNPQGTPDQNPGFTQPPPFEGPYPGAMPPPQWGGPQGYMGYPPPHYGYYQAPYGMPGQPWQGVPNGMNMGPPPGPDAATQAGFSAALGDMADKNGLGMFKEFLKFEDGDFWKGAVVGAAVVLLMTNENLRNSLIGGAAKTAEAMKAGFANFAPDSDEDGASADEPADDQSEESGK